MKAKYFDSATRASVGKVKWLKANECPWDSHTFSSAAINGNLENMIWLKENGCFMGGKNVWKFNEEIES